MDFPVVMVLYFFNAKNYLFILFREGGGGAGNRGHRVGGKLGGRGQHITCQVKNMGIFLLFFYTRVVDFLVINMEGFAFLHAKNYFLFFYFEMGGAVGNL